MKNFFEIKSSRTLLNVKQIEAIYRADEQWNIRTASGSMYPISNDEYWDVLDMVRSCDAPKMMPPMHPQMPPRFDEKRDEHRGNE